MDQHTLTLVFRSCAGLLLLATVICLWQLFRKKQGGNKHLRRGALLTIVLMVLSLFTIIFYTANADFNVQKLRNAENHTVNDDMIDAAKNNFIFKDVQLFTGVAVHLIIVLSISFAYWYMWRRSKKLPPGPYTLGYRIVLLLGMCFVAGFAAYAVYNCLTDEEYREQVYFKTYAGYFVGNLFIMLVASMVSAAGMPDDKDEAALRQVKDQELH